MNTSKRHSVDKHVELSLKKINNETERNLRCLSFAKQYYQIDCFEEARRYVSTYLSVKPNSAEGQHLLGKCLEALGKKEAALQAYTTSLRLDPKQNNLVLKVCSLLASDEVEMDRSGARYFCEVAQNLDPNNPGVINLKQRLITSISDNPEEVSTLLLKELEARPTDVKLRVRLLKHLLQYNMVKEAYKHVCDIETKDLQIFQNSICWYETVAEVLVKYQKTISLANNLGWQFWFLSVSTLNSLVSLALDEHLENLKTSTDYINLLVNFDQTLSKAAQNLGDCPDKHLVQEFLNHYRAELCFHLATLAFKQANRDHLKFKEVNNITLPLLFAAYHAQPPDLLSVWFNHAPDTYRSLLKKWRKEGAFRCSQSGHILQSAAKDRKTILLQKGKQYSMGLWREQLFKKLFITRDHQLKMKTSFFLTDQNLVELLIRLPHSEELLKYDEEAQIQHPDSLHHLIWIAANNKLSNFKCIVFEGLSYSVKQLKNCSAESLNVLDIESFIYCATLCAKYNIESARQNTYRDSDKPDVLPAAITQELGTLNQKTFFKAAYRMFKNEYDPALDQLRITLVEGIKILRCVDNGLDVKVLVTLAKVFAERAKALTTQSEIEFNEARAELYWKAALPILEKMKNDLAVSYPPNKLFSYRSKEIPMNEVCGYIESGKLFSGLQFFKKKEYEKALQLLEVLKDPYASFHQAQIYKAMADEQTNQSKENVTSEMRSQNIILLSRARDCFYLTLDRLRLPAEDAKHPLNAQLGTEIENIERLLSRIDPDCTNRIVCDGMSDDSSSSANTDGYYNGNYSRVENVNHSTPFRSGLYRREAKPSPERLDAQLRQLAASKDAAIGNILEHNKIVVDSLRHLVEEFRTMTVKVDDLKQEVRDVQRSVNDHKATIPELDGFKNLVDVVYELKKAIAELKKDINKSQLTDEDIYGLAGDADYGINANLGAYNPYGRLPGAALYPPALYPGMYPAMAYYGGLGLPPFAADQQLASDFRALSASLPQVPPPASYIQPLGQNTIPSTSLGAALLAQSGTLFKDPKLPTMSPSAGKAPPVNVVITSSDPLPSKTPTSQPILSVTIPPQYLKGDIPKPQPHNYQIPLPTTPSLPTSSPSVLSKPPPAISTQSLLSNIAPPVYSAVADPSLEAKDASNVSTSSLEDHDPCPDFKPIVPLPEEVPVTTGEENETVLFSERAKLYRYSSNNGTKEWKERGVGLLKILQNPNTQKVRILMRRDQVHKICANHFLLKDMTLTPMPHSDRAYIWAAHDYADEEVVPEKFCVKFKSSEEAGKFYEAFEKAKNVEPEAPKGASLGGFVFSTQPTFQPKEAECTVVAPKVARPVESAKTSPFANFSFKAVQQVEAGLKPDEDEFVPTAEFKPVVALPELVEVKTGEEDSEVLFESRAKLLRFDTSGETKEWKERGVGTIKLLKDNTVRLVMRREQVHKVCCNHQLLKNMEFKIMNSNPKALTWCAKDFSEGVIKSETFAIRFKTEELAGQFLKAIREAQESLDENSSVVSGHVDKHMRSEPIKTFGDKFKPAKGSWPCKNCYIVNDAKQNYCAACETPKNDSLPEKSQDKTSGAAFSFSSPNFKPEGSWGSAFKPKEGSWECQSCYTRNEPDKPSCVSCETPKDGALVKSQGVSLDTGGLKFSFGVEKSWGDAFKPKEGTWECKICLIRNNPEVLYCVSCDNPKDDTLPKKEASKGVNLDTPGQRFTFGLPPAKDTFAFGQSTQFTFGSSGLNTEKKETQQPAEKFVFGSPQKHDFEFTPRSPRRVSGGDKNEESDGSYLEEESDNIYFKPAVPLPEKVEVKTGEENEEVLYCHRAKLYRFTAGEWKERGLGDIKILKRKDSGKLRVLMRREQVFKICLNHVLTPEINYLPKDEKTWLFCAPDFSEGELTNEQFCVRFKSPEIAQEFRKAVEDALNQTSSDQGEGPDKSSDDDVAFVCESKITSDEEREATELGLPPKFMSYRQLKDCECEQCKKDDEYLKDALNPIPIIRDSTISPSLGSSFGSSIYATPKDDVFSFKSTPTTTAAPTLKNLLSKPSLIAASTTNNSSGLYTSAASLSDSNNFQSPIGVFGNSGSKSETTGTGKFSFAALSSNGSTGPAFGGSTTPKTAGSIFGSNSGIFATTTTTSTSVFGGGSKSTPSGFGGTSSPVTTTAESPSIFKSPLSTVENTGSLLKNFGSIFGATTTGFGSGSIFGGSAFGANKPLFGSGDSPQTKDLAARPIFGATAANENLATANLKEEDPAVLDSKSGLSFASLAAKVSVDAPPAFASTTKDTTVSPFSFLGAGTPVFSGPRSDKKDKSTEDVEEGGHAEEEYDPHYEPIVPLPDAIVVSTGEEDESVLFADRAKLFRFDVDAKEWKERGVGQMKVLHHETNNTYRFLLRREQVHKVVLNQLVIPDLELQPMKTSDRAWVWAGYNYTDDGSALEKLAVRFKNCEVAQEFHNVVQDVIEKVKKVQLEKSVEEVAASSEIIPSSIQNYGLEDVSSDDQQHDPNYEDDEDEDEDDDDGRTIMFIKRCTLSEEISGQWKNVMMGDLQVYYDPDLYAARICINDDNGCIVSNTLIGINTVMEIDNNHCTWKGVEWCDNEVRWRKLRATFSSIAAAQEFHSTYLEGLNYAQEFDVVDGIPVENEEETEHN